MLSTTDLKLKFGKSVKPIHMHALNKLSLLLNSTAPDGLQMPRSTSAAPLPRDQRRINRAHIAVELAASSPVPSGGSSCLYNVMYRAATRAPDAPAPETSNMQCGPRPKVVPGTQPRKRSRKNANPASSVHAKPDFVQSVDLQCKREILKTGANQWQDTYT